MMLLEHELPTVRLAALQRLALPAQQFRNSARRLLPAINENPGILPGFWISTQKPPTKLLRDFVDVESEPVQQSQAILLLLAAGEGVDLPPLESQLAVSHGEFTKLSIAAAFAESGALTMMPLSITGRCMPISPARAGGTTDQIIRALYEVLRDLAASQWPSCPPDAK